MNKEVKRRVNSNSANDTELIAEQLGQKLTGGEVIELVSDLGGGKTTFVCGLAKGMGSLDKVASPTFTIRREYYTNDLTLYHFDFYRLQDPGTIAHDLAEVINKPVNVVVVEWGEIVQGVLPAKRLTVHIKTTGETTRTFEFSAPLQMAHYINDLKL